MCNSTEIVENQEAAGAEKIGRGGHHGSAYRLKRQGIKTVSEFILIYDEFRSRVKTADGSTEHFLVVHQPLTQGGSAATGRDVHQVDSSNCA